MYRCDNCGKHSNKSYSDGTGWLCENCFELLTADFSGDNGIDDSTEQVTIK